MTAALGVLALRNKKKHGDISKCHRAQNQRLSRLEITLISLAALSALPGILIALATTGLVLTTLTTLAVARLPLPGALNAATLA